MATNDRLAELKSKFDENPRRYFAPLANEYRKQGDLTQAVALCRTHLPNQPGHVSGHIVLGQALYEARELGDSRHTFEAALDHDPENLIALRYLGDIAREQGAILAARAWYQRVLDADPRNGEIVGLLEGLESAPSSFSEAPTPQSTEAVAEPQTFTVESHVWQQDADESETSEPSDAAENFASSFEAPAPWSPAADTHESEETSVADTDPFGAFSATVDASSIDAPISEPETEVEDWFALADMTAPSTPAPVAQPSADADFPDFGDSVAEHSSAADAEQAWSELNSESEPDFSTFSLPSANAPVDVESMDSTSENLGDFADASEEMDPSSADAEFTIASFTVDPGPLAVEESADEAGETDAEDEAASTEFSVDLSETEVTPELSDRLAESQEEGATEYRASDSTNTDVFEDVVSGFAESAPDSEWDEAEQAAQSAAADRESAADDRGTPGPVNALDLSGWDAFSLDEERESHTDMDAAIAGIDPVLGRTPDLDEPVTMDESTPIPFVTETMAELYLQQGFADEALTVYRQLLAASPNDTNLRERVEALEKGGDSNVGGYGTPMGDSARDFFGRFARLKGRPQSGNAAEVSHPRMATPSFGTAGLATASEALTQPDGGRGELGALFAEGETRPSAKDARSASLLLSAFTDKQDDTFPRTDLSLASLFSNVPTDSSGAVTPGGISGETDSDDAVQAASLLESGSPQGDIEQFTAWLEGLKKK